MGKKGGRLLRLLRSTRSKNQNREVKKNLPSLQDKRAAQPNEYFRSAGKGEGEMGSDARPHKIQFDYEIYDEIKILPTTEKEPMNETMHIDSAQDVCDSHSSAGNHEQSKFTNGKKFRGDSEMIKLEQTAHNGHHLHDIRNLVEAPHSSTKRLPPPAKGDDITPEDMSEITPEKNCYKKEFPRKKARSVHAEGAINGFSHSCNNRPMDTIFFVPERPCSSSNSFANVGDRLDDSEPSTSGSASSDHKFKSHCQIKPREINGHFDKCYTGNDRDNRQYTTNSKRHRSLRFQEQLFPTYMNDERDYGEFVPNSPRLAFTVTDKEGKGIELTIAVYGASSHSLKGNAPRNHNGSHVNGRRTSSQGSTVGMRYGNVAGAIAFDGLLDIHTASPVVAMSPNPEAMSAISPASTIAYRTDGSERMCKNAIQGSCLGDLQERHPPKETYKLTEDSIMKLKSFLGQKMNNDAVKKTVFSSYEDVKKLNELAKILERVEECPWYWGNLSGQDSKKVLTDTEPGTFLLRLSSDPKYLFSLSVKTRRGPTSIRIVHENGYFRFDSELNEAQRQARNVAANGDPSINRKGHPNYVHRITKKFTCVIHLVLYYTKHLLEIDGEGDTESETAIPSDDMVRFSREDRPGELFMCYWVTRSGRKEIPVLLSTPLPKKQFFPSLQNLCRSALSKEHKLWDPNNQAIVDRKELPSSLRRFIKQYPYPI